MAFPSQISMGEVIYLFQQNTHTKKEEYTDKYLE